VTWSYNTSFTASKDKVRFLVSDTDTNDQLVSDEEIAFALVENTNIYRAASIVARSIGLKLSRELTLNPAPGGVSLDSQAQAEKYLQLAEDLAEQATAQGAASIFAGGISIADKQTREGDTDRPVPSFSVGTFSVTDPLTDWRS
jgi:hypothetical protein